MIEIDGKQHDWFSEYDEERTVALESLGVRMIRFTNAEVRDDIDSVLVRILTELRLPFS